MSRTLTLFEEKYLANLAFILLNAIAITGEYQAIMNRLNPKEKVQLIQQLPNINMPPAGKKKVEQVVKQSLKQDISPKVIPVAKSDPFTDKIADMLVKREGKYPRMYKDIYGHPTIGIGHLVKPHEMAKYKNAVLSPHEMYTLMYADINEKLTAVRKDFPRFDSYPEKLKMIIVDGYFRGDLSGSPTTKKLIRLGKFKQAADEYLDNVEYRKSVKAGTGVAKRMRQNALVLKSL